MRSLTSMNAQSALASPSRHFLSAFSTRRIVNFYILVSSMVLLLSACGAHERGHASRNASTNAVDSIVQPETDMRIKSHRSQQHPGKLESDESEIKGDIANDNSA
jgi:hypothetical protein